MKLQIWKFILLFTIVFFAMNSADAQRKIVGKPLKFEMPQDFYRINGTVELYEYINEKSKKSKNVPWIVVSDRNVNKVYEKPGGIVIDTLNFSEWYYVVDEDNEWIQLVSASRKGLKIDEIYEKKGWIKKDNVLLWTDALYDESTGFQEKVLLRNRLIRDLKNDKIIDKNYGVYISPYSSEEDIHEKGEYPVYYVYKIENDRLLIGEDSRFVSHSIQSTIIGWVPKEDVIVWKSRLAIEPNFKSDAFAERKKDQSKRVIGWRMPFDATQYGMYGEINESGILWDYDPVTLPDTVLSKNGRRIFGNIMRFPLLDLNDAYATSCMVLDYKLPRFENKTGDIDDAVDSLEVEKVYISKKAYEANHDALSYVVYLSKEDLDNAIKILNNLLLSIDYSSERQREVLLLTFKDLYEKFIVVKGMDEDDFIKTTFDDFVTSLLGFSPETLGFQIDLSMTIEELLDTKSFTVENYRQMIDRFQKTYLYLKEIQTEGLEYEYIFRTGNSDYYWIPLEVFLGISVE